MISLDIDILQKLVPSSKNTIAQHFPYLEKSAVEFGFDSPKQLMCIIPNIIVETMGFQRMVENLNYSDKGLQRTFKMYFKDEKQAMSYAKRPEKIANYVYANRNGNGNEKSGDGWKFRGRAALHITGKNNYQMVGDVLGLDLIKTPELLEKPEVAYRAAGVFWKVNKLDVLAEKLEFTQIVNRITGGYNGLEERKSYYLKLLTLIKK